MGLFSKNYSNIHKYYLAYALASFWFTMPIGILYLQRFGISYSQIALMEIVSALPIVLLEIPTGVFGDFIGKKQSVFIGSVLTAVSMFIIGLGSALPAFLLGYFLWGLGNVFISGSLQALFYDSVKKAKKIKHFLKFQGKGEFIAAIFLIVGTITGAFMYEINIRLPWLLFGSAYTLSALVILWMDEPYRNRKKYSLKNQLVHAKKSLLFMKTNRQVKWLTAFFALSSVPVALFVNIMEQPVIVSMGYSVIALGFIFAISRSLSGIFALYLYKIERALGEGNSFLLISLTYVTCFILLGLIQLPVMILLVFALFLARDYKQSINQLYINRHIESSQRATVLSIQSFVGEILFIVFFAIGGILLDAIGLDSVMLLLGLFAAITLLPLLKIRKRR